MYRSLNIWFKSTSFRFGCVRYVRGHSFSAYVKFPEKTNISYLLIRTRACAYQGGRVGKMLFGKYCLRTKWSISTGRVKYVILVRQ